MPRIPEYEAPNRELTPSDKGASGFEQAGRRLGPLYNEAGTFVREAGAANAALIRERKWPFDMLELERQLEAEQSGGSSKSGGAIKVSGGFGDSGGASRGHHNRAGGDVGAVSAGAGALGRIAGGIASNSRYHNSLIDPETGLDLNRIKPSKYDTVLDHGQLRKVDRTTGQYVDKAADGPNDAAAREADGFFKNAGDPKYDAKYRDVYGVDPSTGQFQTPASYTGGQLSGNEPGPQDYSGAGGSNPGPGGTNPGEGWWNDTIDGLRGMFGGGTGTGGDYGSDLSGAGSDAYAGNR